jgi:hypothetical protein
MHFDIFVFTFYRKHEHFPNFRHEVKVKDPAELGKKLRKFSKKLDSQAELKARSLYAIVNVRLYRYFLNIENHPTIAHSASIYGTQNM